MAQNDQLFVSWERIHRQALALASQIAAWGEDLRGLVAVARGGMIPTAIIANHLQMRAVASVSISSYRCKSRVDLTILNTIDLPDGGAGWVVVDDLADIGRTAHAIRGLLPRCRFATLYVKPEGQSAVDAFVECIPQQTWIVFPWEVSPEEAATRVGDAAPRHGLDDQDRGYDRSSEDKNKSEE